MPKAPADATLQGPTISAALNALAQSLGELAEAAGEDSNIDRRFVARLKAIADAIPKKRPNQIELFRLGHAYDELGTYGQSVATTWPEPLAARYVAATRAFERILRRFPKWVDFTKSPELRDVTPQAARDIAMAAEIVVAAQREPDGFIVVDPFLPEALESFATPLASAATRGAAHPDVIELGMDLLAEDLLESVNNILKRLAEGAFAVIAGAQKAARLVGGKVGSYASEFGQGADESLRKSFRKAGEGVGPAVVKLLKRALFAGMSVGAGPTLAAWLTQNYPQMFGWLEAVAAFMRHAP